MDNSEGAYVYRYPRWIGWMGLTLSLLVLSVSGWMMWVLYPQEGERVFAEWLLLATVIAFTGLAAVSIWFIRADPVALRVDARGLEGRYLPFLRWDQISAADVYGSGRYAKLGLGIKDPRAFRKRLSLWEKQTLLNISFKYDYVISLGVLDAPEAEIQHTIQSYLSDAQR